MTSPDAIAVKIEAWRLAVNASAALVTTGVL